MPALNWGMIDGGGAFESLIHALLFVEDPSIVLLGRLGKDCGQDARSADGTHVYQAKYRKAMTMAIAIQLAKGELEIIAKYRNPNHPNSRHWSSATKWTLCGNFTINSNDVAAWNAQIVPAFREIGLEADYWSAEEIENKLIDHPEIQDVFFNGNNRTLLGVDEAFEWLERTSPAPALLSVPLLGRQVGLDAVQSFLDNPEKSILAVTGPHGVGKSRFMFEAMNFAIEHDWRVFWGLTCSMKASQNWFCLLNSARPTCVFIDEVDSADFIERLQEQTSANERRNWKFVIAVQPEHEAILSGILLTILHLDPLSEEDSQNLTNNWLPETHPLIASGRALHLFSLTQGLPAWQCLLLEEAKNRPGLTLPDSLPNLTEHLIASAFSSIPADLQGYARIMLGWFAAWGMVKIESQDAEEFKFLADEGIPENQMETTLSALVKCGLIRQWGIGSRNHAIEPAIVRQQILCDGLLATSVSPLQYAITRNVQAFIGKLIRFQAPNIPALLDNLCRMAVAYLPGQDSKRLLRPIFDEFLRLSTDSLRTQHGVLELLKHVGHADPDAAWDILRTLRTHMPPNETVESVLWGASLLTHDDLLLSISDYLFDVAKYVDTTDSAKRFLAEIKVFFAFEKAHPDRFWNGQAPSACFPRLIGHSRCDHLYMPLVAGELRTRWTRLPDDEFLQASLKAIWNPRRENVTHFGRTIHSQAYHIVRPDNPSWKHFLEFRNMAFATLRDSQAAENLRREVWRQLRASVSRLDGILGMVDDGSPSGQLIQKQLLADLKTTLQILDLPHIRLPELAEARGVWEHFLGDFHADAFSSVAKQCEAKLQERIGWPVQKVFSGNLWNDEAPLDEIVSRLKQDGTVPVWTSFFDAANEYLETIPDDKKETIIPVAAGKLMDKYVGIAPLANGDSIVDFARELRSKPNPTRLERAFSSVVGKRLYWQAKTNTQPFPVGPWLDRFLDGCPRETDLLADMFWYPHPLSLGDLTASEFQYLAAPEREFSPRQQAVLLPPFFPIAPLSVQQLLTEILADAPPLSLQQNELMWEVVESLYSAGLRYGWSPGQIPITWLMDNIVRLQIDANILERHPMEWLRARAGWKFSMVQFADFIQSRIELESKPKPYDAFSCLPYHFPAEKWCSIGPGDKEQDCFNKFCESIASGTTYIAIFQCPELLPQIDRDGSHIASFAATYFSVHKDIEAVELAHLGGLIAHYDTNSPGWRALATEICKRTTLLSEKDRNRVFRGFMPPGKVQSGTLGSVPKAVEKQLEKAQRQYDGEAADSPLKPYLAWSLDSARRELEHAQQQAEEERHGEF